MELNNILQGVMIQQTEKLFGEILIKTLIGFLAKINEARKKLQIWSQAQV
jgi:hypothetical protein